MEAMGEWSTGLGGMYTEEADFMNQLLASYEQPCGGSSSETTATLSAYHHGQGSHWPSSFCFSQESSSYSGYCTVVPQGEDDNNRMEDATINTNVYLVGEETSECDVAEYYGKPLDTVQENHGHHSMVQPEDSLTTTTDEKLSSKKRMRPISTDKNKRANKARRSQKGVEMSGDNENSGEEEYTEKARGKRKAKLKLPKTCCSDDDESNGIDTSFSKEDGEDSKALNLNGKTRASRGAATDPQSLYARKRRERINERLRILQNLVPNGTKVDISTMLEEAVQYVKFLQLQIKLLSSDDLWMYAPIAYNGMDIGLDLKLNALTR
ncbi:hypothetical protein CARUB_v10015484mg [Capsella rubella]|uniref:BHLH domain-containing protein n=1 Tax=Capsella rubella TaxID=81985 RepID=R0I2S2_9BRAS|nr:transcription factor bHLH84 isoform X2 [Capsella rubella]EOA32225.1 hypothetical protein CARUB_v10015484mg [Capsella rubella]